MSNVDFFTINSVTTAQDLTSLEKLGEISTTPKKKKKKPSKTQQIKALTSKTKENHFPVKK